MSITTMHDGRVALYQADCREVLRGLADNSIDSVVTDPPYALVSIQKRFGKPDSAPAKDVYGRGAAGFMGKTWDTGEVAFSEGFWAEVLRVLKPGGHVVAFSGTRTYHRMAVAIEDAGFEIRDQLGWVYGSGFPKSHNQHGDWEGWGTALKPAWEPIALARKPLIGTVAANLEAWGVGAINVQDCRIGDEVRHAAFTSLKPAAGNRLGAAGTAEARRGTQGDEKEYVGRWPANIVHDGSDEVLVAFPDAPGQQGNLSGQSNNRASQGIYGNMPAARQALARSDSETSAARFFYCAKASRADRDAGLERLPPAVAGVGAMRDGGRESLPRKNIHPTVKPTTLMQWLCRLVTPPDGVILDPFMGSGSTGKAAVLEGFQFIGCEREDEYMPIATARISWAIGAKTKVELKTAAGPQPAVANDNKRHHARDLFGAA